MITATVTPIGQNEKTPTTLIMATFNSKEGKQWKYIQTNSFSNF